MSSTSATGAARASPRVRLLRSVLLGALAALLALAAGRTTLFRSFELRTVDQRFLLRGTRQAQTPLALVFIGDDSIEAYGHWPWSWTWHAMLIDALKRAGARLVLFDVLFAEAPSTAEAGLLEGATRQAGNVRFISYFASLRPGDGIPPGLLHGDALTEPVAAVRDAAAGVGHANALPDLDGTTRRIPLVVRREGALYPSAAIGAAADLLGVRWNTVRVTPRGDIELHPPGGAPLLIPVDGDGRTQVNFLGGLEAFPVQLSYRQVLEADQHPESAPIDLSLLKDRTVLVGVTFTGNTDLRSTPFSSNYPMFLVQATLIDNILRRDFIRQPPAWLPFLGCLLLGGGLGAATFALRPLASFLLTVLLGTGYAAAAVTAFDRLGWQLDLVVPLTTVIGAFGLETMAQYVVTRGEKLRALERLKHLGHLVGSAAEAIFSIDRGGRIVSWNAGAERIYGFPETEALGRSWDFLVPPEARERFDGALSRLAGGEDPQNLETSLFGRAGQVVPVEITFSAIRDSRGQVTGTSAISQDLTEKQKMLEALIRSERLAEIGRMGSGIVHEMKNPLTAIMMMSDFIVELPEIPEKGRRYADIIQKESQRILRLSQNILSFARPQPPEMKATDLNRVLSDTLLLTEYEMKKVKAKVREELDACAPPVWGDGEKLKQVFLNLVVNAAHAMPEGSRVEVGSCGPGRILPRHEGEENWPRHSVGEEPSGPIVTAWIRDHGSGIPAEILPRIFDQFFSTKEEGKGTGLGLYISRNIVLEHRGRITVASQPGDGTLFTIELPAATGATTDSPSVGTAT
jgi:PAS domain S-box-containing protein